ncbi:MAG: aminoacyl-tRNA hydrolase [Actinobacteria bacterium]|nr:aminoacyl-tRNA hydrolase [Actinomycetota bacterium]
MNGSGSQGGLRINRTLTIPEDELRFRFSASGGPGGQHANKAATRAELSWDVASSRAPGPRQRQRIRSKLANRVDATGVLRVVSDTHRSQLRNRQDALDRLGEMVAGALKQEKKRVATKPSRAAKERRIQSKKKRSRVKSLRRSPVSD